MQGVVGAGFIDFEQLFIVLEMPINQPHKYRKNDKKARLAPQNEDELTDGWILVKEMGKNFLKSDVNSIKIVNSNWEALHFSRFVVSIQ